MNRCPEVAARDRAVFLQMLQKNILRPMTALEAETAMLHHHFWRDKNHKLGELPHKGSIQTAIDLHDFAAAEMILKAHRLIIDFKRGLNQWVLCIQFRANGLQQAMDQTQRNDMTGYVDVNEAYYNDLIMESFQPMFGWTLLDPMIMQLCPHGACFRTLCFGFRSAPYYFTRKLRLPLEWIRAWGIRLADVMDDILVLAAQLSNELPEANALRQLMVLLITLDFLGYRIQLDKKGFYPSVSRQFAGGFIFTTLMWIDVIPKNRTKHVNKVQLKLDEVISRATGNCHALASPRELLSIANTVISSRQMISHVKIHMMNTRQLISKAQRQGVGWDQWIPVPPSVTQEWRHFSSDEFKFWMGKPFNLGNPDLIIAGDASGKMLGGCVIDPLTMLPDYNYPTISMLMPHQINGVRLWDGHSTKTEPAARALLTKMYVLMLNLHNALVMYLGDNKCSEANTNKEGGRIFEINKLMEPFEPFFRARRITSRQAYTPGKHLVEIGVDGLSRTSKLSTGMTEVVIRRWVFQSLTADFQPTLDLFASTDNKKCDSFWTRYPSHNNEAAAINTLTQPLMQLPTRSYAFPPVKVILTLLKKFRDEAPQTALMLLIVPFWRGQPWFPVLMQMMCSKPTLIPLDHHHFRHPLSNKELQRNWFMISMICSPNPLTVKAFRVKLQSDLCKASGQALASSITTPYEASSNFKNTMDELGKVLQHMM